MLDSVARSILTSTLQRDSHKQLAKHFKNAKLAEKKVFNWMKKPERARPKYNLWLEVKENEVSERPKEAFFVSLECPSLEQCTWGLEEL